jgi:hypothetical protein
MFVLIVTIILSLPGARSSIDMTLISPYTTVFGKQQLGMSITAGYPFPGSISELTLGMDLTLIYRSRVIIVTFDILL